MNKLLYELNRIARDESEPPWLWMCMFCGKSSQYGKWMERHIESHLKQCEGFEGLLEGEWEDHTITIAPEDKMRARLFVLGRFSL